MFLQFIGQFNRTALDVLQVLDDMDTVLADNRFADVADLFQSHGGFLEAAVVHDAVVMDEVSVCETIFALHTRIGAVFFDQVFKGGTGFQLGFDFVHSGLYAVQDGLFGSLDHFFGYRFGGGFNSGLGSGFGVGGRRFRGSGFFRFGGFRLLRGFLLFQAGGQVFPVVQKGFIHRQQDVEHAAESFRNIVGRLAIVIRIELIGSSLAFIGFFVFLHQVVIVGFDFFV